MHDVFSADLESSAKALGLTRVPVTIVDAPGKARAKAGELVFARSTEPWVFKGSVHGLIDLELDERRDNLHHRSSGLDTTSAKLCAKHDVLVIVNLANLRTLDPIILGRVMQNIELCRSHGAPLAVVSSATSADELPNERDVQSLLITLGASPGQAKAATSELRAAVARSNDR